MKAKERRELARQMTNAQKPGEWGTSDTYGDRQEEKKEDLRRRRIRKEEEDFEHEINS